MADVDKAINLLENKSYLSHRNYLFGGAEMEIMKWALTVLMFVSAAYFIYLEIRQESHNESQG